MFNRDPIRSEKASSQNDTIRVRPSVKIRFPFLRYQVRHRMEDGIRIELVVGPHVPAAPCRRASPFKPVRYCSNLWTTEKESVDV